jgi:hypothetical protein
MGGLEQEIEKEEFAKERNRILRRGFVTRKGDTRLNDVFFGWTN